VHNLLNIIFLYPLPTSPLALTHSDVYVRYLGVYHTYDEASRTFNVHLAQSFDLLAWECLRTLVTNADMPDLMIDPATGMVSFLSLLRSLQVLLAHEQWMSPQSTSPCRVAFALFPSVAALLVGASVATFIAPASLSDLEGTPSIYTWDPSTGSAQVGVTRG
jgi:hypothetical protein